MSGDLRRGCWQSEPPAVDAHSNPQRSSAGTVTVRLGDRIDIQHIGAILRDMPRDPEGRKRPADVIGNAVLVMRIATGEIEESLPKTRRAAGGKIGGPARAKSLSPEKRTEIAKKAAKSRWSNKPS
ncbi:MAG: hypothetical protein WAK32_03635 [Xanthobacteraceae bacterium]